MSKKSESEFRLESSLCELEKIVEKLDSSKLPLEESLNLFENGIKLVKQCEKHLASTEQKIEILTSSINDNFSTKPFNNEEQE